MDLKPVEQKLAEVVKKHGKEMAKEIVLEVIFVAVEQAVKESKNPIDDMVLASLEGPIKQKALELIEKI